MSKDIRSMRDQIKAPKRLVEAAKRGERLYQSLNTPGTHIRHFSKAIVAYACAALVLVGGVSILVPYLKRPDTPADQPAETTAPDLPLKLDMNHFLPTYIYPHNTGGYFRPDLIWANELNRAYENDAVLGGFYSSSSSFPWFIEQYFNPNLDPPAVNPSFAVEWKVSVHGEFEKYAELLADKQNDFLQEYTGWNLVGGQYANVFEAPLYDVMEIDVPTLITYISVRCHEEAGEDSTDVIDMGISLTVVWQGGARTVEMMTREAVDQVKVGMSIDEVYELIGVPFRYASDTSEEYDLADGGVLTIHYKSQKGDGTALVVSKICFADCARTGCHDSD